jgi:hypothetical protein
MTNRIEAQCDRRPQGHLIEVAFNEDVDQIDIAETRTVGKCPECGATLLLPRGRFRASAGVLRWTGPLPMANRSGPVPIENLPDEDDA